MTTPAEQMEHTGIAALGADGYAREDPVRLGSVYVSAVGNPLGTRAPALRASRPRTLADAESARRFVAQLQDQVEQRAGQLGARVRAGIGGYHPGLHGVSRSYLEAQQAFEAGRKLRPDSVAHRHDDVIPHLVLAQNPLLAERFVTHSLGRLTDPKVRNREQLLETLEAYLAKGSVKDAAGALGLHRHTVLYRLEKLKELLGGDLDVPATRLRLQLALDLRKLL